MYYPILNLHIFALKILKCFFNLRLLFGFCRVEIKNIDESCSTYHIAYQRCGLLLQIYRQLSSYPIVNFAVTDCSRYFVTTNLFSE